MKTSLAVRQSNPTHPSSSPAGILEKCRTFKRHDELKAQGLYPFFQTVDPENEPLITCHARKMIMMSSNNYLGLTNHSKVKSAARRAIDRYGTGCSGSRFLNGTLPIHNELEQRLAEFFDKPAAVVFPTGFQANLGAISALVGRNQHVIIDKTDHASIYDGCQLSFGRMHKYEHNNMQDLQRMLSACASDNILVVVDGVFSMDGDIVNLPEVSGLCRSYGACLMVDDAHGVGVLGESGAGTSEHFALTDKVDLIMATFSKSLASIGGCLAADLTTIEYIKHHARSLIFSASLPPACAATAITAMDIIRDEPERRHRLWRNASYLRSGLVDRRFDVGVSETPIIPILIGDEKNALLTWRGLFDEGVFATPVFNPAVPMGRAMLRMSCTAAHTVKQLDYVLDALERVRDKLNRV